MVIIIGLFFSLCNTLEAKSLDKNPTLRYSSAVWGKAKANPYFLVEGRGAGRLFLSWTPEQISKVWHKPFYNSFENPTTLRFIYNDIELSLLLKNGNTVRIRYFVRHAPQKWFTALGVDASLLQGLNTEQSIKRLIEHYQKKEVIVRYIEYPQIIDFTSLGIRYCFSNDKLLYIDIYQDTVPNLYLDKIY